MNVWQRIFGGGEGRTLPTTPDFIQFTNDKGNERVRMVMDNSRYSVALRHNMTMIYGRENVPETIGMVPVIDVKDKDGTWKPVTGSAKVNYDIDTQLGALASFRETGIIGPQPVTKTATPNGFTGGAAAGPVGTGGGGADSGQAAAAIGAVPGGNQKPSTKGLAIEDVISTGVKGLSFGLPAMNVNAPSQALTFGNLIGKKEKGTGTTGPAKGTVPGAFLNSFGEVDTLVDPIGRPGGTPRPLSPAVIQRPGQPRIDKTGAFMDPVKTQFSLF